MKVAVGCLKFQIFKKRCWQSVQLSQCIVAVASMHSKLPFLLPQMVVFSRLLPHHFRSLFTGPSRSFASRGGYKQKQRQTSAVMYVCAGFIFMTGVTYAGVPIYRRYCQVRPPFSSSLYSYKFLWDLKEGRVNISAKPWANVKPRVLGIFSGQRTPALLSPTSPLPHRTLSDFAHGCFAKTRPVNPHRAWQETGKSLDWANVACVSHCRHFPASEWVMRLTIAQLSHAISDALLS